MNITKKSFSNLFLLKIFVLVVFVLVFFSLIFKGVGLFLNRSFDESSFTLLIKSPKETYIAHLDREFKSIEIFSIPDLQISNDSILKSSLFFMIPIDGIVTMKKSIMNGKNLFSASFLFDAIINRAEVKLTNFNNFDLAQMYFFAKSIRSSDIILTTLKKDVFVSGEGDISALLESIKNKNIINERKDIEIDNATEIDGFGARVAQVLKNEGFNVVITKSREKSSISKILFRGEVSKTSERLEKIFSIKAMREENNSIADITIIIGNDIGSKINN